MTTRALVADRPWSHEKARAGLLEQAVGATGRIGGRDVQLIPEPLVRKDSSGRSRQSIRVVLSSEPYDPQQRYDNPSAEASAVTALRRDDVLVRTSGGTEVDIEVLPGPAGSTRVLVPSVETPTEITVALPMLDSTAKISLRLEPVRPWSVHLVHHSHLDIGYTDPQGRVLGEHVAFLDSCLDLTRATDDRPEPARFRWAVESLWSFEQWARARTDARVREFVQRVRDGQIELTAMPYNLHTDTCSTEELHELLRTAREVSARHGIRLRSAMQTDVPGTVAGLPDALADAGVEYLSVAHNWAGRSVPQLNGGQHLPRLFRWRSAAGNSVLVWMTDSPHGLAYMEGPVLGFSTSYEMVDDLLPAYLTSLATHPYPFPPGMFGWHGPAVTDRSPYPWDVLHLRVQGHFGDNAPPRVIHSDIVQRWNESWTYPRLRLSTNTDFFDEAEERIGDRIPQFGGDWGDWWVEGVGSGARPQALTRRAQDLVTDAQTISSLGNAFGGSGVEDERAQARQVYSSISLFNEHTWGASNPWTDGDHGGNSGEQQWHWKYNRALSAYDDAEVFVDHASARLGASLQQADDGEVTFAVVNTTGTTRSGTVSLFVRESLISLEVPLSVVDGRTGQVLPSRTVPQQNPTHRDAGRFVHVHVGDVPAFGLVRVGVRAAESTDENTAATSQTAPKATAEHAEPHVLENEHLRVEVDLQRSCIASIVDKATGRELVDQEAVVGLNGYVYDRYTTAGGFNHQSNKTSVSPQLELLGSRELAWPSVLIERTTDAVEQRLTYQYTGDGLRRAIVTLTLPTDASWLRIENRFAKNATMDKESAYLAFPFAFDAAPTVRYEISGAVTGSGIEHVPGAPQHMRAIRHWVSFSDEQNAVAWVTRDAPLVLPEVIPLPYAPFPDSTAPRQPGTVYSWVHNNIWDTNFPPQQGFEMSFEYAIGVRRAGEEISVEALATRTTEALTHPLVGVQATGGLADPGAEAPSAERSLLRIADDRVRVVSITGYGTPGADPSGPADRDLLVKLQSYADEPIRTALVPELPVTGAWQTTYLGESGRELPISEQGIEVTIPAMGSVAVRCLIGPAGS